jgi:metal-responsive CopG/Arc/MetJ family transcriptional regulator
MKKTAKVAVSIPMATFRSLERERRRAKKTRSAAVTEAITEWLRSKELGEADRRYVEGYLKQPETAGEVAASEAMAIDSMAGWEPWK